MRTGRPKALLTMSSEELSVTGVCYAPPRDATLRSLRAQSLQRAGAARVGPVAAQDQSIFLVREVVGELLTGRTNVNVLLSHVAEILLAEAAAGVPIAEGGRQRGRG